MPRVLAPPFALVLGSCLLSSAPSGAQTVRYDFDSNADLLRDGFAANADSGTPEFASGIMRLRSTGYSEWDSQATGSLRWLRAAPAVSGWWFEFRMQVSSISGCPMFPPPEQSLSGGPGIWVNDSKNLVKLQVVDGLAGISYPEIAGVTLDTTAYHVYRIANLGARHIQVVIDGKPVVDLPVVKLTGNGAVADLNFGDLGGCHASDTNWDYLSYDTVAPPPLPGDADGDGVANATDDCVLVANADQADADRDGAGDACDPCPHDPGNDADADGICGDVDPCPTDARNDMNHNGVCDTMECANARGPTCPSICFCGTGGFIGFDPPPPYGGTGGVLLGAGGVLLGGGGRLLGAGGGIDLRGTGGTGGRNVVDPAGGNGGGGAPGSGVDAGAGDRNPSAGATTGLASDAPSAGPASRDGAGCGCSVARQEGRAALGLFVVVGLLGRRVGARRSRGRRNR
jgi:hypothetical protein